MKKTTSFNIKNILAYSLITLFIFIAISPVIYSSNYIRQDDLMWEIWPGMKMSDFGYLYYNTVFQLVRPICMLSFYITDLISINITNAVYVRLFSIFLLIISGIMLYHWQLRFNKSRLLAITFAITTFTLPAYQVFAATANYELILTSLIMTLSAAFFWHNASLSTDEKKWKIQLISGCVLYFASMLNYPLSTMFIWALLSIVYVNTISSDTNQKEDKLTFITRATLLSILLMIGYYIFSRTFHLVFHVNLDGTRVAVLNTDHIFSKLNWFVQILGWHSFLWDWTNTNSILKSPFPLILTLFTLTIYITHAKDNKKITTSLLKTLVSLGIIFSFIFLAYSPVLAANEHVITYRYSLVTMPILLYLVLWSFIVLFDRFVSTFNHKKIFNTVLTLTFLAISVTGVYFSNTNLVNGIVGPHDHEFAYIQDQLKEKVIPLLKDNRKVLIHATTCNYQPNDPSNLLEYQMNICMYQQQVIGVIVHSLRKLGYPSNFNAHNNVIYKDNQIILKNTPWGALLVDNPTNIDNHYQDYKKLGYRIIRIDTRNMPIYQKNSLYKKIFRI